jgi:hypothetical protein
LAKDRPLSVDETFLQRPDGHEAVTKRPTEQEQHHDKLPPRGDEKVE